MKPNETVNDVIKRKLQKKLKLIDVAMGRQKAELVLKNASYVNVFSGEICKGDIAISGGLIAGIGKYSGDVEINVKNQIVTPGLFDAHIHLESSLVSPLEFAKAAISHGTTTVIADPHEIANVLGADGIKYMIEATENIPVDVSFMLPSCVPATEIDESGATLSQEDLQPFYKHERVLGLAEMMNYVGVINGDKEVISKIIASQAYHKKIDGHAPGLSGKELNAYCAAGVYSDHECFDYENALEKLRLGQYIMIREGTAAKNLSALVPLLNGKYAGRCMFATDDAHPNDLLNKGHIDYIIKKAIKLGVDPVIAIKAATYDPAKYFLKNHKGAIAPGLVADIVVVDSLMEFNVKKVIKRGEIVYDNGRIIEHKPIISKSIEKKALNSFNLKDTVKDDFKSKKLPLIGIIPNEILTENLGFADGIDVKNDILKMAVVERHKRTGHIGLGYIKGYGLKDGAIATSIAHDSHNIIAVGSNDEDISLAVNAIKKNNGGMVVVKNNKIISLLPLAIAGLMSEEPIEIVVKKLSKVKESAYKLGVNKNIDPFMTLSFMSLPVIPKIKLTTHGVFDVEKWKIIK